MKHTPGDWFTKREGWSTVYVETRLRAGVIQEVAACGPTEAGQEQQEANARLIAAAPDLLASLQAFIEWRDSGLDFETVHKVAIKAREAIQKATGE